MSDALGILMTLAAFALPIVLAWFIVGRGGSRRKPPPDNRRR